MTAIPNALNIKVEIASSKGGEAPSNRVRYTPNSPPDLSWSTAIATLASVLVISRVVKLVGSLKVCRDTDPQSLY